MLFSVPNCTLIHVISYLSSPYQVILYICTYSFVVLVYTDLKNLHTVWCWVYMLFERVYYVIQVGGRRRMECLIHCETSSPVCGR